MSDWWYVVVVAGLAVAGILYLRSRANATSGSRNDRQDGASTRRDFVGEREDARLAHMSEEDRTWQAASLQRNREAEEWEAEARSGNQTKPQA